MPNITYGETTFTCQPTETVLDTLLRENIRIPNACRQGVCQSCLMRCLDKSPPALAQMGLKDTLKKQNYFLACACHPKEDMTVALPNTQTVSIKARVIEKHHLAADITRLVVQYDDDFEFYAGQFINLQRHDGLTRSYSIANRPEHGNRLEFHIRRLPNGQFSGWVCDDVELGTELALSEAQGSCYYIAGRAEQPLLLVGTGSGLAPLYGILGDALAQGHVGDIHLFHGSRTTDGLYLVDEMRELSVQFTNFYYTPCLSGDDTATDDYARGRAHEVALARIQALKGWRVYLCGHPDMVNESKRMAYLKGASLNDIYADAFHIRSSS